MGKKLLILLLILVVCLLLSAWWLYPAFRFLRNYQKKVAGGVESADRRELRLKENNLNLHIYAPSIPARTTLLIVPGLHPQGIEDPRFIGFAVSCAEAGFQVIAPDIREFRDFHITQNSIDDLETVIDAVPRYMESATLSRFGILGISYGAGPALCAAAGKPLDFFVAIGGYYNLSHAIEFSFSGGHPGGARRGSHEWGRLIFTLNHVEQITSGSDTAILRESLALRLQLKEQDAVLKEALLSEGGKLLLQEILKGLSDARISQFRQILQKRSDEALKLSPDGVLKQLSPKMRSYLLHGRSDDAVPYEETQELHDALSGRSMPVRSLITDGLTHVDVSNASDLWGLIRLLHWMRLLLSEA